MAMYTAQTVEPIGSIVQFSLQVVTAEGNPNFTANNGVITILNPGKYIIQYHISVATITIPPIV